MGRHRTQSWGACPAIARVTWETEGRPWQLPPGVPAWIADQITPALNHFAGGQCQIRSGRR
jgi:hypothetical protein